MPIEDLSPDVQSIIKDSSNPEYTAYWRGDPAAVAKVEAGFKKAYPETSEPAATNEPPLDPDLAKIKVQFEGGEVDLETEREAIAKENYAIETSLRQDPDFGADYDSALRGSMDYARELVDGDDELYHAIAQSINEKLGPEGQVKILKQLWKMARGRQ
jgi:hypothetical protein